MTEERKNKLVELLMEYQAEEKLKVRYPSPWNKVEEECAEVILATLGHGDVVWEKGDLFGCLLDFMHERPHAFIWWLRRLNSRGARLTIGQDKYVKLYKY